ncbi:MAG TPA: OmpH family outer membrane protein [Candidatus Binataceae bacterium]|nr:OmpH family outer membrane protein [Candidatus Binataceae bacterium]
MRQAVIVGVMLLAMAAAVPVHADVKLAYVDLERALNDCQAGKRAKADFRGRIDAVQASLERQQAEVQALKDELQKKGMLMQPDQRQNLEDEYTAKLRDFEQSYKNERDELRQKDNEMTGAIIRDLATVVREIGEKDGYTLVLEKGGLLWGIPSIDITDEVIRTYDGMNVKVGSLASDPRWAGPAPSAGAPDASDAGGASGRSSISR